MFPKLFRFMSMCLVKYLNGLFSSSTYIPEHRRNNNERSNFHLSTSGLPQQIHTVNFVCIDLTKHAYSFVPLTFVFFRPANTTRAF